MVPLMIAGAVAQGMSSIMAGRAASEAAALRNAQAHQKWIQANTQKTMNNARSQFQAAYQTVEQMKRNSAIMQSAYRNEFDQTNALKDQLQFQTKELSINRAIAAGALRNALGSRNINQGSGLHQALARAQLVGLLSNINQIQKNNQIQQMNIAKQFQAEMNQQTNNIFMPNIELYDAGPMMESTASSALPGILQIGGAIIGGIAGASGGIGSLGGGASPGDGSALGNTLAGPPDSAAGGASPGDGSDLGNTLAGPPDWAA